MVAGYSVGGALAFYYAANAGGWGVPRPSAAYSIFPIDPVSMDPGLLHLGPPPRIPSLILVGDRDANVGSAGGTAFRRWLTPVPKRLKTYRLLHSSLFFDHESPTDVFDAAIRKVFWSPLDGMIAKARGDVS